MTKNLLTTSSELAYDLARIIMFHHILVKLNLYNKYDEERVHGNVLKRFGIDQPTEENRHFNILIMEYMGDMRL